MKQQLIDRLRTSRPMQAAAGCVSLLLVCVCGSAAVGVVNSITGDDPDATSTLPAIVRQATPEPESTTAATSQPTIAQEVATATVVIAELPPTNTPEPPQRILLIQWPA